MAPSDSLRLALAPSSSSAPDRDLEGRRQRRAVRSLSGHAELVGALFELALELELERARAGELGQASAPDARGPALQRGGHRGQRAAALEDEAGAALGVGLLGGDRGALERDARCRCGSGGLLGGCGAGGRTARRRRRARAVRCTVGGGVGLQVERRQHRFGRNAGERHQAHRRAGGIELGAGLAAGVGRDDDLDHSVLALVDRAGGLAVFGVGRLELAPVREGRRPASDQRLHVADGPADGDVDAVADRGVARGRRRREVGDHDIRGDLVAVGPEEQAHHIGARRGGGDRDALLLGGLVADRVADQQRAAARLGLGVRNRGEHGDRDSQREDELQGPHISANAPDPLDLRDS